MKKEFWLITTILFIENRVSLKSRSLILAEVIDLASESKLDTYANVNVIALLLGSLSRVQVENQAQEQALNLKIEK